VERFQSRPAQVALTTFSAVIVLIGLAALADPSSRGTGVILLPFGLILVVRAARSPSVEVDGSGVSTRDLLRTRRYEFAELESVEVAVGRTGMTGFGREYLVFRRTDGKAVAFRELSARRPKNAGVTVVRRAAASINERLTSGRGSET
jgi:hypothetical protein